nr:hypothetical protein [Pandoravirus massiliensis]
MVTLKRGPGTCPRCKESATRSTPKKGQPGIVLATPDSLFSKRKGGPALAVSAQLLAPVRPFSFLRVPFRFFLLAGYFFVKIECDCLDAMSLFWRLFSSPSLCVVCNPFSKSFSLHL